MKTFKRILCPVDFSEFSDRALDMSVGLASDFDAEVSAVYVADIRMFAPAWASVAPEMSDANRQAIEAKLATLAETKGIDPSRTRLLDGLPGREIARHAKEGGFDLVVMGTHGATGFERLVLGSVTENVLHRLEIPLLTVSRSLPPNWNDGKAPRIRTILLATDLGPESAATIDRAVMLGTRYGSKLLALHAMEAPQAYLAPREASWVASAELEREFEKLKKGRRAQLESIIPEEATERLSPEFFLREGSAEHSILDLAQEREVDLIVLGVHGYGKVGLGWLGSTSQRVIRHATCPVLALRD